MFWFSGSVNEAINKSKNENKLFVVFISGKDDISAKMDEHFESLSSQLSDMPLVAIRLESQSDNCKLFSQIYPVIVIPSTYFIDSNGVAIEIIGGSVDDKNVLLEKINKTIEVYKRGLTSNTNESIEKPKPINTSNTSGVLADNQNTIPLIESNPIPSSSNIPSVSSPSVDAKVERANQLIEAIRQKKAKEEAEKEKLEEIERRKSLKEMQNSKRMREEKETQEVIKEREREKREEKLAKDRILAQIAADKEERRARQMAFTESQSQEQSDSKRTVNTDEPVVRERVLHDKARIQFRLPDGSTRNNTFEANDKLERVRQYVSSDLNIRSFILSTTFPRKEFESNDFDRTLQELSLCPSSVLLVIPKSGTNTSGALTSQPIFWQIWTLIVSPFVMIWSLMSSVFGSSSASTNENQSSSEPNGRQSERQRKSPNFYNRDANMGRIRGNDRDGDEDDDNNTWNGNSTQQM